MAIYGVSLSSLERLRKGGARGKEALPEAAGRRPATACAQAGEQATKIPSDAPTVPSTLPSGEKLGPVESAANLLNLSRPQVEALLSEQGGLTGKAWLTLISRLASIETQLASLSDQACTRSVSKPPLVSVQTNRQEMDDTSKAELLEQVFGNNLLLRRMD